MPLDSTSTSRSAPPSTCTSARLSQTLSPLSRASDGSNELYDYAAEEHDFQAQTTLAKAHKTSNVALHKHGCISMDSKARHPTQLDLEQSDDER